jgi:hypothetical protein
MLPFTLDMDEVTNRQLRNYDHSSRLHVNEFLRTFRYFDSDSSSSSSSSSSSDDGQFQINAAAIVGSGVAVGGDNGAVAAADLFPAVPPGFEVGGPSNPINDAHNSPPIPDDGDMVVVPDPVPVVEEQNPQTAAAVAQIQNVANFWDDDEEPAFDIGDNEEADMDVEMDVVDAEDAHGNPQLETHVLTLAAYMVKCSNMVSYFEKIKKKHIHALYSYLLWFGKCVTVDMN